MITPFINILAIWRLRMRNQSVAPNDCKGARMEVVNGISDDSERLLICIGVFGLPGETQAGPRPMREASPPDRHGSSLLAIRSATGNRVRLEISKAVAIRVTRHFRCGRFAHGFGAEPKSGLLLLGFN